MQPKIIPEGKVFKERKSTLILLLIKDLNNYYDFYKLPVRFGDLFRRYTSRIFQLGLDSQGLCEALEESKKLKLMYSPRNRKFIFPFSALKQDDDEILHQLTTADQNFGGKR